MPDKKHIDRLFQEGFKDFEVTPRDEVWTNIEAKLTEKKKKRSVIPIWWRYAGVAALLLLLLTIGGLYFNNSADVNSNNQIVDTKNTNTTENQTNPVDNKSVISDEPSNSPKAISNVIDDIPEESLEGKIKTPINESSSSVVASAVNDENSIKENTKNVVSHKSERKNKVENVRALANNSSTKNTIVDTKNALETGISVAATISENTKKPAINTLKNPIKTEELEKNLNQNEVTATSNNDSGNSEIANNSSENELNSIEEAIEENEVVLEETEDLKTQKWSITPNAAPVYFNTLGGEGSSIDPQFNNNSKSGDINMSYGISASYAINKKVKIRSGVNRVNLGYNTNDVVLFRSVGVSSSRSALKNVEPSAGNANFASDVSVVSAEAIDANAVPESLATSNTSINQSLGFIEIPLEVQYTLSNKKLGVNLIGGFSSFFLNDNEIFSEDSTGGRTLLGEASNINDLSYSANLGLGLSYKIGKQIDLNLEPMFKYQFNTFKNTSGNFTPFFIGVYTGFAIKF